MVLANRQTQTLRWNWGVAFGARQISMLIIINCNILANINYKVVSYQVVLTSTVQKNLIVDLWNISPQLPIIVTILWLPNLMDPYDNFAHVPDIFMYIFFLLVLLLLCSLYFWLMILFIWLNLVIGGTSELLMSSLIYLMQTRFMGVFIFFPIVFWLKAVWEREFFIFWNSLELLFSMSVAYSMRCGQSTWQPSRAQVNQMMKGGNVCWLTQQSHCPIFSQVSRAWRVLAEDAVLWFRMCRREGYHGDASVSDSPCWKSTLRDCRNSDKALCSNWKVGLGCALVGVY